MLRGLYALARRALVVNDLRRARVPYAVRPRRLPLRSSARAVSVDDGLLSIRRAFTAGELARAFADGGLPGVASAATLPYRLLAVARERAPGVSRDERARRGRGGRRARRARRPPSSCASAATTCSSLDEARFPRDKVCGEGVSPEAWRLLEALGAAAAVRALRPQPLRGHDARRAGRDAVPRRVPPARREPASPCGACASTRAPRARARRGRRGARGRRASPASLLDGRAGARASLARTAAGPSGPGGPAGRRRRRAAQRGGAAAGPAARAPPAAQVRRARLLGRRRGPAEPRRDARRRAAATAASRPCRRRAPTSRSSSTGGRWRAAGGDLEGFYRATLAPAGRASRSGWPARRLLGPPRAIGPSGPGGAPPLGAPARCSWATPPASTIPSRARA